MLTQVVRVDWIIDCIYLNRRIREEDYEIRSFKSKQQLKVVLKKDESSSDQTDHTISNRKSISMSSSLAQSITHPKKRCKDQSDIFAGYYFYVESSQRKESELISIGQEIERNKGRTFPSRMHINTKHCFYVLKDC